MVDYIQDNAKAYARAKVLREKRKAKPPVPSIKTTRREKLRQAKEHLEKLSQSNASVETQYNESVAKIAEKRAELEAAENSLVREQERTRALEAEFAVLKG